MTKILHNFAEKESDENTSRRVLKFTKDLESRRKIDEAKSLSSYFPENEHFAT